MAGRSRSDRIGRRGLIVGACGLAATGLPGVLAGCAESMRDDEPDPSAGSGATGAGSGGAGSGGAGNGGAGGTQLGDAQVPEGGGGSGGAAGTASRPDAGSQPNGEPSCAQLGERDRVVDFQVTAAFRISNPLGIVADPRIYAPLPEALPWLKEPICGCYDVDMLAEHVLGDGATSLAVLGMHPYHVPDDPSAQPFLWSNDELLENVAAVDALHPGRALAQITVMPNDRIDVQLAMMERFAPRTALWKVFTDWGGGDGAFFLDEEPGRAMIEKALELELPIIAVHKGKGNSSVGLEYSSPRDIGPTARRFAEARLVVCNAAFEHGLDRYQTSAPDPERPEEDLGWGRGVGEWPEGPYEEHDASVMEKYPLARGVNSLIKSLRDAGIGPNGTSLEDAGPITNVYVTSGAAWPSLISRPEEAMHFWGKLLKHVGEDRVLWGTDSPSFGPPRAMIEAFRAFEISEDFQDRYGYPALTAVRKAKILGGNALRLFAETGRELPRCDG